MPLLVKAAIGLLALAAIAAAAATAYVLVVLNNPSEATAQYIPASATAYFSVNLRPGLRQTLDAGSFFSKIDSDELEDWREERLDEIEDETGIHPADDVSEWLGTDISAAILNDDLDQPEWIVMLQVSDREGAEDFAEDLADYIDSEYGVDFDEDTGGDLSTWTSDGDDIAIGVSDQYLLIGDSEDTVADIADNVEESPRRSLLDNEAFAAAREAAPTPRVAFGYLDLEDLLPDTSDVLDLGVTSEQLREELGESWPQSISMATAFLDGGVRMDVSYVFEDEMDWDGPPVQAQRVLPSDTLAALSVTGLLEGWEQWWSIIEEADPYAADDVRLLLDDFEEEIGIDVEDDVLDALSGEFAVALLPGELTLNSISDLDWESPAHVLLLAGVEDPDTLEDTLDDLLDNIREDYDYDREDIGEFEAITAPGSEVDGDLEAYRPTYVLMDDWAVMASTLESAEELHDSLTGEAETLADNAEFRRAMDASVSPVHHFVYANIAGIAATIDDALSGDDRREFRNDVLPYIENLSVFLFTASFTEEEMRMSAILTAAD